MKTANMSCTSTDFDDDLPQTYQRPRFENLWNVRTICRPGAVTQLEKVLSNHNADITALQEMQWTDRPELH